jgi:hypothetical protein
MGIKMIIDPQTVFEVSVGDKATVFNPQTGEQVEVIVDEGYDDTIYLTTIETYAADTTELTEENYHEFIHHLRDEDDVAAMTREKMSAVLTSKNYRIG